MLVITPPLDPLDPRSPWYARCDHCDFFDFGERPYIEDAYRGAPCPDCELELSPVRQISMYELLDGSGDIILRGE